MARYYGLMDSIENEHIVKLKNKRYIFMVSDNTGKTCNRVVRVALRQFKKADAILETIPDVRTEDQIHSIMNRAAEVNGIIIYTLATPAARQLMSELSRLKGVPTLDIFGPVLTRFSDLLELSPLAKPVLGMQLDHEYFRRIEAIDFTIKHDDSMRINTVGYAEVVLLGVSRTTKTPVSIYLSYRGWKVANIPIVMGYPIPQEVLNMDQRKIIALTIKPSRLKLIRLERQEKIGSTELVNYTDDDMVRDEVNYGLELYRKNDYPIIDVTYKSIEETATEVMRTIYSQMGIKKSSEHY